MKHQIYNFDFYAQAMESFSEKATRYFRQKEFNVRMDLPICVFATDRISHFEFYISICKYFITSFLLRLGERKVEINVDTTYVSICTL